MAFGQRDRRASFMSNVAVHNNRKAWPRLRSVKAVERRCHDAEGYAMPVV